MRRRLRGARADLGDALKDIHRARASVRRAGENVREAGEAGVSVARAAAGAAGEHVGLVAGSARERAGKVAIDAGRAAVDVGAQLLHLPDLVREGARRSVEMAEEAGTRAVVGVIQAGTRMLSAAAGYVSELTPHRRVRREALEEIVVEQITWARAAAEAYDRTVKEIADGGTRTRLVRFKLQAIKQAEALTELLHELGGRVPSGEAPIGLGRDGRRARLAHALTISTQSAEGWKALAQIAALAEQDDLAEAIACAAEAVADDPDDRVDFLRGAVRDETIQSVLA
jgi:hypothetical protein